MELIGGKIPIEEVQKRIRGMVRRYKTLLGDEVADLEQEAWIGVTQAVQSYREGSATTLMTWIHSHALGAIRHYVRDKVGLLNRPRSKSPICRRFNVQSLEYLRDRPGIQAWEPTAEEDAYSVVEAGADILATIANRRDKAGHKIRAMKGKTADIILLKMQGYSEREIGLKLGLSQRAISSRVSDLAKALGPEYKAEAG